MWCYKELKAQPSDKIKLSLTRGCQCQTDWLTNWLTYWSCLLETEPSKFSATELQPQAMTRRDLKKGKSGEHRAATWKGEWCVVKSRKLRRKVHFADWYSFCAAIGKHNGNLHCWILKVCYKSPLTVVLVTGSFMLHMPLSIKNKAYPKVEGKSILMKKPSTSDTRPREPWGSMKGTMKASKRGKQPTVQPSYDIYGPQPWPAQHYNLKQTTMVHTPRQ